MGRRKVLKIKMFLTFFMINYISLTFSATIQKVLLISLDGFRWDFQNKTDTPNLDWIIKHGVTSNYVQNVFPYDNITKSCFHSYRIVSRASWNDIK